MRLGIASKAEREPADNKLFIKALASLSLENECQSLLFSHIHGKIITEPKECCFAFVIRGKKLPCNRFKITSDPTPSHQFPPRPPNGLFKIYYGPLFVQSLWLPCFCEFAPVCYAAWFYVACYWL